MPKKQTLTDQVVWLLLQAAIVQDEIKKQQDENKKMKQELQELQEYILKRSCQAEAIARSNDVCRTPPSKKYTGGELRTRSPRTPPTPRPTHPPPSPPSTRATRCVDQPLTPLDQLLPPPNSRNDPLSPLFSFTTEEILECLSPSFDLERELKLLEKRVREKRG